LNYLPVKIKKERSNVQNNVADKKTLFSSSTKQHIPRNDSTGEETTARLGITNTRY